MALIKCKMCGGDLALVAGQSVAECEYCGSRQTVPSADNDKKLTLFARANRLRAACEFDKAAGIYESIVADFPEEAEAYWGLVLCKYGIEYVDDPATGKKIPTCHRSSFDSVMDDSNFEQAQENADTVARKVYREEAKALEEIRKGIISVSANESPYDIFICYKETDENGDRTLDSVLAQDLYDALTEKGYRVFFSRITLEDKLGMEYEPYIFAALNSAKIMLAVGTDYEYFNAVWVKNEWSRFLKLMAKDKDKHLIPCFKGIDAYDMPREFARLQAQDLGKVGAMQDLLRGIEKYIPLKKHSVILDADAPVESKIRAQMERGMLALEDSDWKAADLFFENVLDLDHKHSRAYMGKLLAEFHVKKESQLADLRQNIDESKNYEKVMRFGDTRLKNKLSEINRKIKENIINHQRQMDVLESKKGRVLAEIQAADQALQQAQDHTKQIETEIIATKARISQMQDAAVKKLCTAEEMKHQPPGNTGKITFFVISLVVSILSMIAVAVLSTTNSGIGSTILITLVVHYLFWLVIALHTGNKSKKFSWYTARPFIHTGASVLAYAVIAILATQAASELVGTFLTVILYGAPIIGIIYCTSRQLDMRKEHARHIVAVSQEAAKAQRAYIAEAKNSPALKRLTQALEQSHKDHRDLEDQYKQKIHELNRQYLEEAKITGQRAEALVPERFQMRQ